MPAELVAASVRIDVAAVNGSQWGGSGTCFHVAEGTAYYCSNYHVVPCANKVTITFPDGRITEGYALQGDRARDVTVFSSPADESIPFVPLADASPAKGTTVYQVGYPVYSRTKPMKRSGRVQGTIYCGPGGGATRDMYSRQLPNFIACFAVGIQTAPGDSGSGVFNQDKQLCGMIWGGNGSAVRVEDIWQVANQCDIRGWFRRRQPPPQDPGAPAQPPPPPRSPIIPRVPDFKPLADQLKQMQDDFAALKAQIQAGGPILLDVQNRAKGLESKLAALPNHGPLFADLQNKLAALPNHGPLLADIQSKISALPNHGPVLIDLQAKAKALQEQLAGLPATLNAGGIADIKSKLADLQAKGLPLLSGLKTLADNFGNQDLPTKIAKIEQIAGGLAPIAGTLSTWLPVLGIGGPAGIGVMLALQLLGMFGKKTAASAPPAQISFAGLPALNPAGVISGTTPVPTAQAPAQVVVQPIQPARTVPTFVATSATDPWADSIIEALTKVQQQALHKTPQELLALAEEIYTGKTGKTLSQGKAALNG